MNKISYYTNYKMASKFAMFPPDNGNAHQFGSNEINSDLINFFYLPYAAFIKLINSNYKLGDKSLRKVILFVLNSIQTPTFNVNGISMEEYNDAFRDIIKPSDRLNFYDLIEYLSEGEIVILFESIYNSRFDYHNVVNACPKVPSNKDGATALYTTFLRFLKLSQENFFRFVTFANYKRIQDAPTVRLLTDQAVFLESKRAERLALTTTRLNNVAENYLFGKVHARKASTDSPLPLRNIKKDHTSR